MSCNILEAALKVVPLSEIVFVGKPSPCGEAFNPLNAKIVAANFSCSAKVVFVKEKRWLCQSIEAPCNALVNVLRQTCIGYLSLLSSFYIHTYNIVRSVDGKS